MASPIDREWLTQSNADTLYLLERQGRTTTGLVPFIGAGLSTAFGFSDWKSLLLRAAPPRLRRRVEVELDGGDYEGAAEMLLKELGPDGFQSMVAVSAGDSHLQDSVLRRGTVSLLPLLASGPVVTTNFDRILERAFDANDTPFESIISGPRPDLIVDALHGNRRVLIKLHGDWQDRVGRTFAKSDYNTNYGKSQPERKRELLDSAERLLFSSRSLLFIGASLGADRTVRILQAVHSEYAGVRHFAIMKAPSSKTAFHERDKHLRSCGVLPLWYVVESASDHTGEVEKLVTAIVERISAQTIAGPSDAPRARLKRPAAAPRRKQPPPPEMAPQLDRAVRLIEDGRLTFVLGAAIHYPTPLLAEDFYKELARVFECEALQEERATVAQYIADRFGRDSLNAEIRKLFSRTWLEPRDTHRLFAAWKSFRTHAGKPVPYPTILTTNYDSVLETVLHESGLPYHLLSYQSDGKHCGLFYHRAPDDSLRIIERPRNITQLAGGFVLVKLNGGLDRQERIPESYATTRLDYWDLAARIPGALPVAVRTALADNPLLFLGHGLGAPDIESLVRFAHKEHPGPRSWAVVFKKAGIEYWRQLGLTILHRPVNLYVNELHVRLTRNGR